MHSARALHCGARSSEPGRSAGGEAVGTTNPVVLCGAVLAGGPGEAAGLAGPAGPCAAGGTVPEGSGFGPGRGVPEGPGPAQAAAARCYGAARAARPAPSSDRGLFSASHC